MRETVVSQGSFLHLDVVELLDAAGQAGFDAINLWQQAPFGRSAPDVAAAARDAGVGVDAVCRGGWMAATGREQRDATAASLRALDDAVTLGARQLVVMIPPVRGAHAVPMRDSIAALEVLLAAADERGIVLALEPFHPLFASSRSAVVTLAMANDILDRLDSPALRIAADAYHLWWDPEMERQLLRAHGRVAALHLSDWRVPEGDPMRARALPGDGDIDLAGFINAVDATGYDGPVEIEVLSDRFRDHDALSALTTLHDRLRAILPASPMSSTTDDRTHTDENHEV